jgi:hypothetical protein
LKKITEEVERIPFKERKKKRRLTNVMFPHDQAGYFFYRKHRKTNNPVGDHRTRFKEAVTEMFMAISEIMIETEGGLYLAEYGYFSPMELKYIKKDNLPKNRPINILNEKDFGLQFFHDTAPKSCIKYMTMDRSFSKNTKKQFIHSVTEKRMKPKLLYTLIKSLYTKLKIEP